MYAIQCKIEQLFLGEGSYYCLLLDQRSPSAAIEFKTPEELWIGKPPNYENLRIFGCTAYIHTSEGKLEPRSKKGIFLVIQKVEESL